MIKRLNFAELRLSQDLQLFQKVTFLVVFKVINYEVDLIYSVHFQVLLE